jgi:hypothetical protein
MRTAPLALTLALAGCHHKVVSTHPFEDHQIASDELYLTYYSIDPGYHGEPIPPEIAVDVTALGCHDESCMPLPLEAALAVPSEGDRGGSFGQAGLLLACARWTERTADPRVVRAAPHLEKLKGAPLGGTPLVVFLRYSDAYDVVPTNHCPGEHDCGMSPSMPYRSTTGAVDAWLLRGGDASRIATLFTTPEKARLMFFRALDVSDPLYDIEVYGYPPHAVGPGAVRRIEQLAAKVAGDPQRELIALTDLAVVQLASEDPRFPATYARAKQLMSAVHTAGPNDIEETLKQLDRFATYPKSYLLRDPCHPSQPPVTSIELL